MIISKNRYRYKLTCTERDILSFFIENKIKKISYTKLWKQMVVDRRIKETEFLRSFTTLVERDILGVMSNLDYTPIVWIPDIPAVVKVILDLERYSSAVVLTALITHYRFIIKNKESCIFNLNDFILTESEYNIKLLYMTDKQIFKNSIYELVRKGYLLNKKKYTYEFKYERLQTGLIDYV